MKRLSRSRAAKSALGDTRWRRGTSAPGLLEALSEAAPVRVSIAKMLLVLLLRKLATAYDRRTFSRQRPSQRRAVPPSFTQNSETGASSTVHERPRDAGVPSWHAAGAKNEGRCWIARLVRGSVDSRRRQIQG